MVFEQTEPLTETWWTEPRIFLQVADAQSHHRAAQQLRAIYRLNIDNDGDYQTDIAFSYVFSKLQAGRQTVNVFVATGSEIALERSARDQDHR
jgi:hypothetical protein